MIKEVEICELIEITKARLIDDFRVSRQKGWNKLYGDICTRLISSFILKSLSSNFHMSEPNAYIIGFRREFDLLVLKNRVKPVKYSNAYNPKDVIAAVEIKANGIYAGKAYLETFIGNLKNNFMEVKNNYPQINFAYLTYQERVNPKKKGSINYFEETKRILSPFNAYCLKDDVSGEILRNQWNRFIKTLMGLPDRM
jgi:hypothetical protein